MKKIALLGVALMANGYAAYNYTNPLGTSNPYSKFNSYQPVSSSFVPSHSLVPCNEMKTYEKPVDNYRNEEEIERLQRHIETEHLAQIERRNVEAKYALESMNRFQAHKIEESNAINEIYQARIRAMQEEYEAIIQEKNKEILTLKTNVERLEQAVLATEKEKVITAHHHKMEILDLQNQHALEMKKLQNAMDSSVVLPAKGMEGEEE